MNEHICSIALDIEGFRRYAFFWGNGERPTTVELYDRDGLTQLHHVKDITVANMIPHSTLEHQKRIRYKGYVMSFLLGSHTGTVLITFPGQTITYELTFPHKKEMPMIETADQIEYARIDPDFPLWIGSHGTGSPRSMFFHMQNPSMAKNRVPRTNLFLEDAVDRLILGMLKKYGESKFASLVPGGTMSASTREALAKYVGYKK